MRSATLMLTSKGKGMLSSTYEAKVKIILKEVEKAARSEELDAKQEMHLRLLAEETICMLPMIMDYGSGTFWIETFDENKFELHVLVKPIDSSSSGRSASMEKQGVLRRIVGAFDSIVKERGKNKKNPMIEWSLQQYIASLKKEGGSKNLSEWDQLEQSILVKLADDVVVSSVGEDVGITVIKAFG